MAKRSEFAGVGYGRIRTRRVQIGTVGVDAGMIYIGDPCYCIDAPLGRRAWDQFLREIAGPDGYLESYATVEGETATGNRFPAGVVCVSGAGDGEYPVYAEFTADGLIARVTIDFRAVRGVALRGNEVTPVTA